jgi:hypothetical protein
MLLNAYGWWKVSQITYIAALAAFALGGREHRRVVVVDRSLDIGEYRRRAADQRVRARQRDSQAKSKKLGPKVPDAGQ